MTLLAVLLSSLIGSVHCAAMCGGFAVMVGGTCGVGPDGERSRGRVASAQIAYALGRLFAYTVLGTIAGLLGASLDLAAVTVVGIHDLTRWVMGALLVGMGLWALLGKPGFLQPGGGNAGPELVQLGGKPSLVSRARRALAPLWQRRDAVSAASIGLLSGLLPCGWLWGFLVVAAATGSVTGGALTMAVFWLGTVPALLSVSLMSNVLARRFGAQAPRLIAFAMIGMGVLAFTGRIGPSPADSAHGGEPCHAPGHAPGPAPGELESAP